MPGLHARTQLLQRLQRLPRLRHAQHAVRRIDAHAGAQSLNEATLAHYDTMLCEEAANADVPVDLLKAVCWYASGWRQYEPGGSVLRTPATQGTSYGCMQLNDVWHPDAFPAALHSAQTSVAYAGRLLRWLYEQTDDWDRATVAFFGHDRRAENAARRVRRYAQQRPWQRRQVLPEHPLLVAPGPAGSRLRRRMLAR